MKIYSIDYSFENKSLDIFISGCSGKPKCQNCHNPELWDFSKGDSYNSELRNKILGYVNGYDKLIDKIIIVGGEPLDQTIEDLQMFLHDIKKSISKDIWLFTRYSLEEVPDSISTYCDYIKTGKYISELTCTDNIRYGIKLATSNQTILKKGIDY